VSASNGVIKIARKGKKKFAFGEDGEPFEVDVVAAWQDWLNVDEPLRGEDDKIADWDAYHQAAVDFAYRTSGGTLDANGVQVPPCTITIAEALDFIARLREVYDDLAVFFRPRSREERASPGTSGEGQSSTSKTELRFAAEES
jgi:hypothetical protein